MRKSTVVSLNKMRIFEIIYKNRIVLILCFLFAVGVILGVVTYTKSDTAKKMAESFFENYLLKRQEGTFGSVLLSSCVTSSLILIVSFLIGASIMGVIISPTYICAFGFCYGIISAFLYSTYSIKGVAFCSVIFIPSTIVILLALIVGSRHSVNFSLTLAKLTLTKSMPRSLYEDFRKYCNNYLIVAVMIFVSSIIDASFSKLFLKFFDF